MNTAAAAADSDPAPDCNTGDSKAATHRGAAGSDGKSVWSQPTPDPGMAAAVAVAHAMFRAERQALHERLTKLCAPALDRGVGAGDADGRAWRADELRRVLDAQLTPQPVHSIDALTAAALRVREGQSADAVVMATRAAFGVPVTSAQRDAMDWISRSEYGRHHEWAAQCVVATQRHPLFVAAAAFVSVASGYRALDPCDRPSDDAVRCALDALLRHGLELNTPLGAHRAFPRDLSARLARATPTDDDGVDDGVDDGDGDDERAAALYAYDIEQYALRDWHQRGSAAWHTPLTLSVVFCTPMARALLSLPASYGLDVHTRVRYRKANAPAVRIAAGCGDAWVLCELVRRSGPEEVARWPVFAECVAAVHLPTLAPTVARVTDVEARCAVVRELLRAFATDDGHAGGLDLHTPPPNSSMPTAAGTLMLWHAYARNDTRRDVLLQSRLVVAYQTTDDALCAVLKRQRVFSGDALSAVLLEALRPVPREVCALVSAYVLAPAPPLFRVGAATASSAAV